MRRHIVPKSEWEGVGAVELNLTTSCVTQGIRALGVFPVAVAVAQIGV